MDEIVKLDTSETNDNPKISQEETNTNTSTYKKLVAWSQKPHARLLLSACAIFGFIFTCFIFVFQILLTPIAVVGASMQPTINANAAGSDKHLNTDIVYYIPDDEYVYKDIVIIDGAYAHGSSKIIKRIIATPGQTIRFEVDTANVREEPSPNSSVKKYMPTSVLVNGKKLNENYIKEQMQIKLYRSYTKDNYEKSYYTFYDNFTKKLDADGHIEYTLKSNEYFCMGDNRNNSTDSRYFGMINAKDIQGKVVLQVPYGKSLFTAIWNKLFG